MSGEFVIKKEIPADRVRTYHLKDVAQCPHCHDVIEEGPASRVGYPFDLLLGWGSWNYTHEECAETFARSRRLEPRRTASGEYWCEIHDVHVIPVNIQYRTARSQPAGAV